MCVHLFFALSVHCEEPIDATNQNKLQLEYFTSDTAQRQWKSKQKVHFTHTIIVRVLNFGRRVYECCLYLLKCAISYFERAPSLIDIQPTKKLKYWFDVSIFAHCTKSSISPLTSRWNPVEMNPMLWVSALYAKHFSETSGAKWIIERELLNSTLFRYENLSNCSSAWTRSVEVPAELLKNKNKKSTNGVHSNLNSNFDFILLSHINLF